MKKYSTTVKQLKGDYLVLKQQLFILTLLFLLYIATGMANGYLLFCFIRTLQHSLEKEYLRLTLEIFSFIYFLTHSVYCCLEMFLTKKKLKVYKNILNKINQVIQNQVVNVEFIKIY